MLGSLALRLGLWWRAEGFEQGDPVEYVNIAYKIAFGIGIPWWDLRPLLLPLIYVPVLLLGQLVPDPTGEAMVKLLRLVGVAFATGGVALVYLLGRRLGGELLALLAGLLAAVNPVVNQLAVSTFAEVPSTFFVLLSIWMLMGARDRAHRAAAIGAGLALGTACMIRYQAIAFVPAIAIWATVEALSRRGDERRDWRRFRSGLSIPLLGLSIGLTVAVVVQGALELVAYGRPFHSLFVSFDYNVLSGLAPVEFGAEPFYWFLWRIPDWLGIAPGVLVLVGLCALARGPRAVDWRLVAAASGAMFLFLSLMPHKELRFMAQVSPLLSLIAAQGAILLASGASRALSLARARPAILGSLVVAGAAPLLVSSARLDLSANVSYVDGPKRAAALKPGGSMGTIPWFVPRPYTGSRLALERMDRRVWTDRDYVARTIEESDFLLFPEYWLLEDPYVRRLVDSHYRTVEAYDNGVVLLQNRRLDSLPQRRPRA